MKLEDLLRRVDDLIHKADHAVSKVEAPGLLRQVAGATNYSWVPSELASDFRLSSLSFLCSVFGEGHPYYKEFDQKVSQVADSIYFGRGLLVAVKGELAGGWMHSTRSLVSAELFTDFLEMAEYLLDEGYKDPAAVIVGGVLEERLRQLCAKNVIDTTYVKGGKTSPRKAAALNDDLAKAAVYGKLDHKQVTAWLNLRNDAAHGDYNKYNQEQVRLMLQGITEWLTRVTI
jgi:hypothetical protein